MGITLGMRFQPVGDPTEIGRAGAECEKAGFESAWMTDAALLAGRWGDPYIALSSIAAQTKTLKIGTAVTNPYMRAFPAVAASGMSLHDQSGGRFMFGMGAGASAARELGMPLGKLGKLKSFTRGIRTLLQEGEVEYDDKTKVVAEKRKVPVYVAAMGPKTIEFAGKEADGVILQVGANRKGLEWAMDILRKAVKDAGRSMDDIDVIVSAQCAVEQDIELAIRRVRHLIAIYFYLAPHILEVTGVPGEARPLDTTVYPDLTHAFDLEESAAATTWIPDEAVVELGIVGTPEDWVNKLIMMEECGVTHVQVRAPESFSIPWPEIEFCRDEVIPRLKKAQESRA